MAHSPYSKCVLVCLGVGAGVINAQLDSVMSRKLRLSTVPAVTAVVGGKLHWFGGYFSVQHLRDFVRGLYPADLIQEVRCTECSTVYGNYTVSRKKRDQNVFCNISYKTRAIVMKFGTQFPE